METQDRLHALDALRAFALFLGIYFHASLSFMPGLDTWAVRDSSTSEIVTWVSGFSHLFRMALFFFIAGYFARLAYLRKGLELFVRDRAKRIGLPLLMFLPVMLVLLGMIWEWGAQHGATPARPPAPPLSVSTFPLTHLWFLYYLLWMYVVAIPAREIFVRLDESGRLRASIDRVLLNLLKRRVAPFVFGLPLAVIALTAPEWNPAIGIVSPDKSLIPQLVPMVGFGTSFAVGWLCHRSTATLAAMANTATSSAWISLGSIVLTSACGFAVATVPAPWSMPVRFLAGLSVSLTFWYWNLFLVGFAMKHLSSPSPRRRYAADSSYWLYIAHLPVVTALQVVAAQLSWHWSIELALILATSAAVLLLSYQLFVRSTWLGAILNGKRLPAPVVGAPLAKAPS